MSAPLVAFALVLAATGVMRLVELGVSVRRFRERPDDLVHEPALFPFMALLHAGLRRRGLYRPAPGWTKFLAQVLAACAAMTLALALVVDRVDWIAMRAEPLARIALALTTVAGAALVYLAALAALGVRPAHFARRANKD